MEGEKTEILQTSQEQITPEVEENLNTVSTGFEQVITLLGQVINSIMYQRRLGVLTAVFNGKKKAKDLMKDMKGLMNEDNEKLFGPKFEGDYWNFTQSVQQQYQSKDTLSRWPSLQRF